MSVVTVGRKAIRLMPTAGAAAVLCALAACGGDDEASDGAAPAASKPKEVRVALFAFTTANPYGQALIEGAEGAAKESGAKLQVFDGKADLNTQLGQIRDATASGNFDAFEIQPVSGAAVVPVVEEAIDAGIKVAAVNGQIGPSATTDEIQVPGVSASVLKPASDVGVDMGKMTIDACAGKDPCRAAFIIGLKSLDQDTTVLKYWQDTVKPAGVELVATQEGQYANDQAYKVAQGILTANKQLDVIVSNADQMALGASRALKEADRTDVKVVGHGASELGVAAVKSGELFGTDTLVPQTEGELATKHVIEAVRDGKDAGGLNPVEAGDHPALITKDNADAFTAQWQG